MLSIDPLIVYTTFDYPDPTRHMRAFATHLPRGAATILLYMSWAFERGDSAAPAIAELRQFRRAYPRHTVIVTCNDQREEEELRAYGEEALLLNQNLAVSEVCFRPIATEEPEFDAIYNARFSQQKRVDLAAGIDRVAYITRRVGGEAERLEEPAILRSVLDRAPGHVVLAGLPIVSIPNRGGRDAFFDPEFCLTVPPDPRAVRDAVIALRNRRIPRDYIRECTLGRVRPARDAFLDCLNRALLRAGYAPRFGPDWPWPHRRNLCQWQTVEQHLAAAGAEAAARPAPAAADAGL